ncbi:MAG: hypothetical protein NW241_20830 [Bacteroidia bacterium]|nr:hypothetical protein [Bacteroidia bacterium]
MTASLARWARLHPAAAWLLILLLIIAQLSAALLAGSLLPELGGVAPGWLAGLLMAAVAAASIFYPRQRGRATLRHRALVNGLICSLAWGLAALAGNQAGSGSDRAGLPVSAGVPAQVQPAASHSAASAAWLSRERIRGGSAGVLRHWQTRLHPEGARALSPGARTLLFVLAFAGGLAISWLVLALACSIACSGASVLGALVLLLGGPGLLAGFGWLYTVIWGIHREKRSWRFILLGATGLLLSFFILVSVLGAAGPAVVAAVLGIAGISGICAGLALLAARAFRRIAPAG